MKTPQVGELTHNQKTAIERLITNLATENGITVLKEETRDRKKKVKKESKGRKKA